MDRKLIGKVTNGKFYLEDNKLYVHGMNVRGCLGAGYHGMCHDIELPKIKNPNQIKEIIEYDNFTTVIVMNDGTKYISGELVKSYSFKEYSLDFLSKLNNLNEKILEKENKFNNIVQKLKCKETKSNIEVFRQITSDNNLLVVIYDNIKRVIINSLVFDENITGFAGYTKKHAIFIVDDNKLMCLNLYTQKVKMLFSTNMKIESALILVDDTVVTLFDNNSVLIVNELNSDEPNSIVTVGKGGKIIENEKYEIFLTN